MAGKLQSRMAAFVLAASAVSVSAQAEPPGDGESAVTAKLVELSIALLSSYATSPDNRETTIIDRRAPISVEGAEGIWFYSQLNTGDEQRLYRQRFHQLIVTDDGRVIQRSFVPTDASRFVDGWNNPEVFQTLSEGDMEPVLNSGCAQQWTLDSDGVWQGAVDPSTCATFSERRQANIRIGADSYYRGNEFGTSERGFDEDMNPIWGSKPGEYIPLTRCASTRCEAEALALSRRGD